MRVLILVICICSTWIQLSHCRPQSDELPQFGNHLETIRRSATELVKLQQKVAKKEKLTAAEERQYNDHIRRISDAAQSLTKLEESKADEDLSEFNDHIKGIKSKIEAFGGFRSPVSDTKNQSGDTSSDTITTKKPPVVLKPSEKPVAKPVVVDRKEIEAVAISAEKNKETESVVVNRPPADASIAEAKPVALSIAGVGGVASAKPVATAVVGPGGLAVARPVATAIAGIDPDEIGGFGLSGLKKLPEKEQSAALTNYKLATKLQKENGIGGEKQRDTKTPDPQPEPEKEDIPEKNREDLEQYMQIQPDLNPYNLIPPQFHNAFKIKAPQLPSEGRSQISEEPPAPPVWSPAFPPQPNYRFYYTY